jgi:hypothetical protein
MNSIVEKKPEGRSTTKRFVGILAPPSVRGLDAMIHRSLENLKRGKYYSFGSVVASVFALRRGARLASLLKTTGRANQGDASGSSPLRCAESVRSRED